MPWQNNGNGEKPNPWGSGGGGPRRGGGSGGGEPPHIDDYIKKGQEQLRQALPGGGKGSGLFAFFIATIMYIVWGVYEVETNEQGVVMRFGELVSQSAPGMHFHFPPIESVEVRGVTNERTIVIGEPVSASRRASSRNAGNREESLMLTRDENIVDVRFEVVWQIKDLGDYLFKLRDPEGTVKLVAESVMRELVGQNDITPIITTYRPQLQAETLARTQELLDQYQAGINVLRVQINESQAPVEVLDAFLDVQRAEADQQRSRNEATRYANEIIPVAEGRAAQLVEQAEAYKAQTVARAEGEAARFLSVYNEYVLAKDVTKKRMYLETMEEILSGMDKIILDGKDGSGVVPYLPLNELNRKASGGN